MMDSNTSPEYMGLLRVSEFLITHLLGMLIVRLIDLIQL